MWAGRLAIVSPSEVQAKLPGVWTEGGQGLRPRVGGPTASRVSVPGLRIQNSLCGQRLGPQCPLVARSGGSRVRRSEGWDFQDQCSPHLGDRKSGHQGPRMSEQMIALCLERARGQQSKGFSQNLLQKSPSLTHNLGPEPLQAPSSCAFLSQP